MVPSIEDPILLYCDNNGAIGQAKEPRSHHRSKHILRRYHLIREIIDRDEVKIEKVHTKENIADPLTKPLSQKKHDSHVFSYGLKNKHCDTPKPGGPLTTHQPAEYSWMSGNLPDIHENRAESPLYEELYPDTSPVI